MWCVSSKCRLKKNDSLPSSFSQHDYKYSQGRPKEWLLKLLPLLSSAKCREAKSMAAFHLCVEATIKKDQQKLELLAEIGAIEALKECASSPDEMPAKFASEALTIIGEEVPYKLSQQVPCWSITDVQYWVEKIGFGTFATGFAAHMVDGDLLLLLTEKELEEDLGMGSGLLRKRFMRELESLKIAADYSSVDETHLDQKSVPITMPTGNARTTIIGGGGGRVKRQTQNNGQTDATTTNSVSTNSSSSGATMLMVLLVSQFALVSTSISSGKNTEIYDREKCWIHFTTGQPIDIDCSRFKFDPPALLRPAPPLRPMRALGLNRRRCYFGSRFLCVHIAFYCGCNFVKIFILFALYYEYNFRG